MSRGQNNNNPFNIIKSGIGWIGKLGGLLASKSEQKFEQFESLELGIRAGLLNLRNGYKNKGFNTPTKIIERYAPLYDNSPASQLNYKKAVATGAHGNYTKIDTVIVDNEAWLRAAWSMQRFENGKNVVSFEQLKSVNEKFKIFV